MSDDSQQGIRTREVSVVVAVWVYAISLFIVLELSALSLQLASSFVMIGVICIVGGLIGTFLAFSYSDDFLGLRSQESLLRWVEHASEAGAAGPPLPPLLTAAGSSLSWGAVLSRAVPLLVFVTVFIAGVFYYAVHHRNAAAAVAYGFLSALAWGTSVIGTLVWTKLLLFSSAEWNGWFNLFAAALAALAVGCMP